MTSNEEEKNEYIVQKYEERLNFLFQNRQVWIGIWYIGDNYIVDCL